MLRYIILTLTLIGCGTEYKEPRYGRGGLQLQGDPQLLSLYYSELDLATDAQVPTFDTDVNTVIFKAPPIKPEKPEAVGYCIDTAHGKAIVIDESYKESKLLPLLFAHEFGHCVLGQNHYEKGWDIMNPSLSGYVSENLDHFRQQLYERIKHVNP